MPRIRVVSPILKKESEGMSLAEKRHHKKAVEVLKAHPGYVSIALRRAFSGGRVVSNLNKDLAWLRGIERCLDVVVLEHLVRNDYVSQVESRRYGITSRGIKLLGLASPASQAPQLEEAAHG